MPGTLQESREAIICGDMFRFLNNMFTEQDVKLIHADIESGNTISGDIDYLINILVKSLNENEYNDICKRMADQINSRREEVQKVIAAKLGYL